MRVLELSDANQKAVESLAEFASLPENRYKPGVSNWVPGDRPEFVRKINTFRLVFTISEAEGKLWRHMSLSVPKKGKLPNHFNAFTLATWCGFTGGEVVEGVTVEPGPWGIEINDNAPDAGGECIIITQELDGEPSVERT